ncbi:hypothetical protein [Qipengyuania nanhaisediminis]|uniref:hypothetical protein n=1 Tax=Qipengyuania nanhaisediminis TaxID=604088 RepID=UPI0038B3586C
MNTPPLPAWQSLGGDARFSAPEFCSREADSFARRVRVRNAIEYAAAGLVVLLFGAASIAAFVIGEALIGVSLVLIVLGTFVLTWNLRQRASNIARRVEEPCALYIRRQYRRQYDALRRVPAWYIGPLLPGTAMFYAVVTYKVARVSDLGTALAGLTGPAAVTFGLFAAVALANVLAARALKRKLDQLEGMG